MCCVAKVTQYAQNKVCYFGISANLQCVAKVIQYRQARGQNIAHILNQKDSVGYKRIKGGF